MIFVHAVLKNERASVLDLLEALVCVKELPQRFCIFELLAGPWLSHNVVKGCFPDTGSQSGQHFVEAQTAVMTNALSCKINYSIRSACARSSTRSAFITVDYVTSPAGIADENDAVPARCDNIPTDATRGRHLIVQAVARTV